MTPMVRWSDFNIDCWFKKKNTFQKKQNVVEEYNTTSAMFIEIY